MAQELSYVNSSLQLLKEELEELDCGSDADGPGRCEHAWGWTRVCLCALDVKCSMSVSFSVCMCVHVCARVYV